MLSSTERTWRAGSCLAVPPAGRHRGWATPPAPGRTPPAALYAPRPRSIPRPQLRLVLLVLASLIALLLPRGGTAAASARSRLLPACAPYGDVQICSGQVPSFDGTPLDVDLSLPATPGAHHPLIIFLHGFGNNKHEWESTTDAADGGDKWHWNSHWFAQHGFYVLTYTARGVRTAPPTQAYQPATPNGSSQLTSPSATIHLKSREFEVRDTQWLAAVIAATSPDLDPTQVAVSGGSYGGGESWLQASQAQWTFPHAVDGALPVLQLQVAVPKYAWTDLAYSLAPNGHGGGPSGADLYEAAQGQPGPSATGLGKPLGVVKASYATGLFALGTAQGTFETGTTPTPSAEGPISVPAWIARMVAVGDPYETPAGTDSDPLVAQVRRGLTRFRSAYYQAAGWQAQVGKREVAIFSISGWTDDLFPALESFRQFKHLKRLDALWPVAVAVADVGHARAQNQPRTWQQLNAQAWQFLQAHISGSHRQRTTVVSLPTTCGNDGEPDQTVDARQQVTATNPEGLSHGHLTVAYQGVHTLTSVGGVSDPNGLRTDPLVGGPPVPGAGGPCRTADGPAIGGYTGVSQALSRNWTYIGLGYVEVPYVFSGQTGQLDARVWDVAPRGETRLVTRGTYRIDVAGYDRRRGTLRLPLFGNHWRLPRGHRLRLDLSQVDQPFLRVSTPPSSITFARPRLVLPTREAGEVVVPSAERRAPRPWPRGRLMGDSGVAFPPARQP